MKDRGSTGRLARRLILAFALVSATVVALWGYGLAARPSAAGAVQRPNIVFVLTDDLDWSLVTAQYMPHVIALERSGETFNHYIVADSLRCPSRGSIFTGLFHTTAAFTPTPEPMGAITRSPTTSQTSRRERSLSPPNKPAI
jgi:hypothetical protein